MWPRPSTPKNKHSIIDESALSLWSMKVEGSDSTLLLGVRLHMVVLLGYDLGIPCQFFVIRASGSPSARVLSRSD
jgi:hypothetical protein